MKKGWKIIFLVFVVLLFSGCEANYILDIDDENIQEELQAISDDKEIWDEDIFGRTKKELAETDSEKWTMRKQFEAEAKGKVTAFYDVPISSESVGNIFNLDYYDIEYERTNSKLQLNYSYLFNKTNFNNAMSVKYFFNNFHMTENNYRRVDINSGLEFSAFYYYPSLESITITVKNNNRVIEHNADEVDGDKYIWKIERKDVDNNKLNKPIMMSYIMRKKSFIETTNWPVVIIVLVTLAILITVAIIKIRRHIKEVNE